MMENTPMASAIVARRLFKKYKRNDVLSGVSFTVHSGSVTALLGLNGAGKSTLMRLICGIEPPDSGTVLIENTRLERVAQPVTSLGMLLSPEWIDGRLTCQGVLRVQAALLRRKMSVNDVEAALGTVELTGMRKKKVQDLSLGMRQRLAVAVALIGNPRILVLDEPVNGLDPAGVRWLRDFLRDFAERGGTVLISSHLISEVSLIASDVIVLDKGTILFTGKIDELAGRTEKHVVFSADSGATTEQLVSGFNSVGYSAEMTRTGEGVVQGISSSEVFKLASHNGFVLSSLEEVSESLEGIYLSMVGHGDAKKE